MILQIPTPRGATGIIPQSPTPAPESPAPSKSGGGGGALPSTRRRTTSLNKNGHSSIFQMYGAGIEFHSHSQNNNSRIAIPKMWIAFVRMCLRVAKLGIL